MATQTFTDPTMFTIAVTAPGGGIVSGSASPGSISPGTLTVGEGFALDVAVTADGPGTITITGGLYEGSTDVVPLAPLTFTAVAGTQVVTMEPSTGTVPSSASGLTLAPMVAVNGGPLTASNLTVQVNTVAGTPGPSYAPTLSASYDSATGVLAVSWSAVSGATDYEFQGLDSQGAPLTGTQVLGLTTPDGSGAVTYDPQGNAGFWTAATSGTGGLPGIGSWGLRVRGTVGIGTTAAVGPWSAVSTVVVPDTGSGVPPGTALAESITPSPLTAGQAFLLNVAVNFPGSGSYTITGGLYSGSTNVVPLFPYQYDTNVGGTQNFNLQGEFVLVPAAAAGLTLTPMVSLNGGPLVASDWTVYVNP